MKTKSHSSRSWRTRLNTLLRRVRRTDFNLMLVGFGLPVSGDQIMIHRQNAARMLW